MGSVRQAGAIRSFVVHAAQPPVISHQCSYPESAAAIIARASIAGPGKLDSREERRNVGELMEGPW